MSYWYSRLVFERGLALIYLIAFIAVVNQFVPLLGEHGLLPVSRFIEAVPFRASPSLFYFRATDGVFRAAGWLGVLLSLVALSGLVQQRSAVAAGIVWALLWLLYLSFVNVGQTFYGFGWESLLLEVGFFTILAGAATTPPPTILNWIYRWTLFRLMFGAGLIKLRGDACWRDLTCLDYYFETQPIPNPLSWYFHWLPRPVLHGGVVFNHVAELIVPFGYLPAATAGRHRRPDHHRLPAHAHRERQLFVVELADDRDRIHDARQPVSRLAPDLDSPAAADSARAAVGGVRACDRWS